MSSKGGNDGSRSLQMQALKIMQYKPPGTRDCCGRCKGAHYEKNGQVRCMWSRPTVRVSKNGWCPSFIKEK